MKNILFSVTVGVILGTIDIIPMLIKKLDKLFIISAFLQWILIGFLYSIIDFPVSSILKGVFTAIFLLLPILPLIYKLDKAAIPIIIMTNIALGAFMGFLNSILLKFY